MQTDLTGEELERAKRWAAMQTPLVECRTGFTGFWFHKLPPFVNSHNVARSDFGNPDAAWSALALALRPIFASVGPVVREEERLRIVSEQIADARRQRTEPTIMEIK